MENHFPAAPVWPHLRAEGGFHQTRTDVPEGIPRPRLQPTTDETRRYEFFEAGGSALCGIWDTRIRGVALTIKHYGWGLLPDAHALVYGPTRNNSTTSLPPCLSSLPQCHEMPCGVMQCRAMPHDAMRCHATLCDVVRCHAMSCDATRRHACNVTPCDAMRCVFLSPAAPAGGGEGVCMPWC